MAAGKTDMERIGFFSELGYTTIKDPYTSQYRRPFNANAGKGMQMMTIGNKSKTAFQDGYFDKKFQRVLEGEAYSDMIKLRRRQRIKETKKNLGGPYVPPGGMKEMSGLGSHYGTLSGPIESLSAAVKSGPKYKTPGKNVLVIPGKRGTGFGYAGVTIGALPAYESDPFGRAKDMRKKEQKESTKKQKAGAFKLNSHPNDYFEGNPYKADRAMPPSKEVHPKKESLKPFRPSHPSKQIGGCKAGTFEHYPKHSEEPFVMPKIGRPGPVPNKMKGGVFKPSQDIKSTFTCSVVQKDVLRKMNVNNYLSMSATL